MASAIKDWLSTYPAVRYQHRGDHPAGKGLDAWQDPDGSTWLKALICDEQAKRMVAKQVLRAFSVGLSDVQTRKSARAPRYEIIGGRLAEVSLVDSPSNARCGIQIIGKSAAGTPEYVGKAFGKVKVPKVGKAFRRQLAALDLNSSDPVIREAAREAAVSSAVTKAAKSGKVSGSGLLAVGGYLDSTDPWQREQAYREVRSRGLHF